MVDIFDYCQEQAASLSITLIFILFFLFEGSSLPVDERVQTNGTVIRSKFSN